MSFPFKILFVLLFGLSLTVTGQSNFNYELTLVPITVTGLPGLHSYTWAQHEGKWLIIGGRKDGIHARQPFNAFPATESNTDIYVVDVQNNQAWSSSVNALPAGIREQLQSTNMNFYQDADTLFIIGGYGFSASANDHITYPYLTSVNVPQLISAIQNNQNISPYFKQIQDNNFAVTGGHLKKLKGLFYLVGGQRFDGRYNPLGNPTFTQAYTNQIRKFSINNSGSQLSYGNYTTITDPVHLRRRDYNLLPQIFPDGEQGFTISSGVFQINVDLPFLYPVDIRDTSYTAVTTFNQYLSNYHSPVACLYDSAANNMHSLFFGGMSQYYYQNGTLVQDNSVPFVKTISRLTRDASGTLTEYLMPVEMPSLKGAGAEFIPNPDLPHYSNKVFRLNDIGATSFIIGHIFGGIYSPTLNPFTNNQTGTTSADNAIYEVWLNVNPQSDKGIQIDGKNPYDIVVYPNPFRDNLSVKFKVKDEAKVSYLFTNSLGQIVLRSDEKTYLDGENSFEINTKNLNHKGPLFLIVIFDDRYYVTRQIIKL